MSLFSKSKYVIEMLGGASSPSSRRGYAVKDSYGNVIGSVEQSGFEKEDPIILSIKTPDGKKHLEITKGVGWRKGWREKVPFEIKDAEGRMLGSVAGRWLQDPEGRKLLQVKAAPFSATWKTKIRRPDGREENLA